MHGRRDSRKRFVSVSSQAEDEKYGTISTLSSKRSGLWSNRSPRPGGSDGSSGLRPYKWLKMQEYLLLLIEMFLSHAEYVIKERNRGIDERLRLKLTSRQLQIYSQYVEGHSTWVSLVLGCLADSFIRHYTMALFSVIVHFATICIVLMEEVVKQREHRNPYSDWVQTVCSVALVLIKSTDFARIVYGLEGMTNRRTSTINIFIFFQIWVSKYSTYGGVIVNVLFIFLDPDVFRRTMAAFIFCGISTYIFCYCLSPDTDFEEQSGLGCKVVGCLLMALFYKTLRIKNRWKAAFFDTTEGTCSRNTILRTREIVMLYVFLSPTFAVALNVALKADVCFDSLIRTIKHENNFVAYFGLPQLARFTLAGAMLISYFVMWPLLIMMGLKNKNRIKFLIGSFLLLFAISYGAMMVRVVEKVQYPSNSGFIRVFNTRREPVHFTPQEDWAMKDFMVKPKTAVMGAYTSPRPALMAMNVSFTGGDTNYTTFLHVTPDQTTGYMILDPPEVVRIRGPYLPLREGPAGTNGLGLARLYFYNTAKSLENASIKIKHVHSRTVLRRVRLLPGAITVIALKPATYDFSIFQAEIRQTHTVEEGALYGLMTYATFSSREMAIDYVLPPDKEPSWPLFVFCFLHGLGYGICYPALRAIVYKIAPLGLMAMSFAYLTCLEGLASWFLYIGFKTWHAHVTGNVLFGYAAGIATCLCTCTYLMLKYKNSYD